MCNACKCGGSNLSGGRAAPRVLRVWHTSQSINGPQSSVLVQTRNWASCNFTTSHICACVWVHVCVRQSKSWNNGRQTTIVNQFSSPFDSFHFFALLSQISLSYCIFLFSSPLASLSFYFSSCHCFSFLFSSGRLFSVYCQHSVLEVSKSLSHTEQSLHVYCRLTRFGCGFDKVVL